MMILFVILALSVFLFSRAPRLEREAETNTEITTRPVVRAYVDGEPVKSYLKE